MTAFLKAAWAPFLVVNTIVRQITAGKWRYNAVAISAKLRSVEGPTGERRLTFWCPGCEGIHQVRIAPPERPCWTWDGNADAPTFAPSILVTYRDPDGEARDEVCHSFVRAGRIEFLTDCTHALAGQTVDLPDLPEGYR